jgi:hypothetical protein
MYRFSQSGKRHHHPERERAENYLLALRALKDPIMRDHDGLD